MNVAQSSHLQDYEYDPDTSTLTITFQNGAVYQYPGVPFDDYHQLRKAGGGGTAFWTHIRTKYTPVKIVDPRGPEQKR